MSKKNKQTRFTIGYPGADDGDWIDNSVRVNNMQHADIIIGQGGVDINTDIYKEPRGIFTQLPSYKRDTEDTYGLNFATNEGLIGVGICRNAQLMCALAGGRLIQHVNNHHGSHMCDTLDGDRLYTNSIHHQMCYPWDLPEDEYIVLAHTVGISDRYLNGYNEDIIFPEKALINGKIIEPEIVWYPKKRWLGIQFHPEMMWYKNIHEEATLSYLNNILKTVKNEPYFYHETYKQIKL